MALFDRFRRRRPSAPTPVDDTVTAHLRAFVVSRRGVEAWVEPATSLSRASVLLVAHDGEWTRRQVPDQAWATSFCDGLGIPVYVAGVVGYPQRMRDHDARRRAERRRDGSVGG